MMKSYIILIFVQAETVKIFHECVQNLSKLIQPIRQQRQPGVQIIVALLLFPVNATWERNTLYESCSWIRAKPPTREDIVCECPIEVHIGSSHVELASAAIINMKSESPLLSSKLKRLQSTVWKLNHDMDADDVMQSQITFLGLLSYGSVLVLAQDAIATIALCKTSLL